jgi:hypothetical protein
MEQTIMTMPKAEGRTMGRPTQPASMAMPNATNSKADTHFIDVAGTRSPTIDPATDVRDRVSRARGLDIVGQRP